MADDLTAKVYALEQRLNALVAAAIPVTIQPFSSPAVPEDWHTLTLVNGWGGGVQYKLIAEGLVAMAVNVTSDTATAFQFGTLPAGYQPASTRYIAVGASANVSTTGISPFFSISSAGALVMSGVHAFSTAGTWVGGGIIKLA